MKKFFFYIMKIFSVLSPIIYTRATFAWCSFNRFSFFLLLFIIQNFILNKIQKIYSIWSVVIVCNIFAISIEISLSLCLSRNFFRLSRYNIWMDGMFVYNLHLIIFLVLFSANYFKFLSVSVFENDLPSWFVCTKWRIF